MTMRRTHTQAKDTVKRERLEARVSAEQKALLQRAADLQGRTLSDFIIGSAQQAAEEIIREHTVITLAAQDSRAFIEAILNPAAPNERLRAAAARYTQESVGT
jgi:uncharacterized protein (DUF1778 family)